MRKKRRRRLVKRRNIEHFETRRGIKEEIDNTRKKDTAETICCSEVRILWDLWEKKKNVKIKNIKNRLI